MYWIAPQVPRLKDQITKLENAIRTEKTKAGRSAQEREKKTSDLQRKLEDLNKSQEEWKNKIEEGGNIRRDLQGRDSTQSQKLTRKVVPKSVPKNPSKITVKKFKK